MSVGKISGVCRRFISSVGVSAMSRPRFSIRQRPKEEPVTLPKKESDVIPEEAKASSMDYQNFGSGNITLSLGMPQEKSLTKPSLSKNLSSSHTQGHNNKLSDNIHKPNIGFAETHNPVYMSLPNRNVFFDFLSQIIGKQQKGLSEIHKGNVG